MVPWHDANPQPRRLSIPTLAGYRHDHELRVWLNRTKLGPYRESIAAATQLISA